jgi:hypothetical protein
MREEETTTLFPVEDILNEVVFASMRWNQEEFASIFYGLEPHQDVAYIRGKFERFALRGFVVAYADLDGRNATRVCRWIADQINGQ